MWDPIDLNFGGSLPTLKLYLALLGFIYVVLEYIIEIAHCFVIMSTIHTIVTGYLLGK